MWQQQMHSSNQLLNSAAASILAQDMKADVRVKLKILNFRKI